MKKLAVLTAFVILSGITYGQTLQKGNLVGVHVMKLNLNPDATMNQFKEFFIKTYVPEGEKALPGMKIFLGKGIRGEDENSYCLFYVFASEMDRDKFFKKDGSFTEVGTAALEKLKPIDEKLSKFGTYSTKYTDWVVQ